MTAVLDDESTTSEKLKRSLSRENVPDLRKFLTASGVGDLPAQKGLLALIRSDQLDRWGVLQNKVLVRLHSWRVMFTVKPGGVWVEFFPDYVSVFPSKDCPPEELGLYYCFHVQPEDLKDVRELLLKHRTWMIDFPLIYHGQYPPFYEPEETD